MPKPKNSFPKERALLKKNCLFFFSDYREVTLELSTVEIYKVPELMRDVFASLGLEARLLKRAVVVARDLKNFLFYETVTVNNGQNAKVFFDIEDAKKWLSEK